MRSPGELQPRGFRRANLCASGLLARLSAGALNPTRVSFAWRVMRRRRFSAFAFGTSSSRLCLADFVMASLSDKLGIPLVLSDEGLAAIGALTATYSQMELYAAVAVWHALGLRGYDGTILTAGLSLRQRLDLVIALGERGNITADDLAVVKEIQIEFSKEKGLSQRRNTIIHGVWTTKDKDVKKTSGAFPLSFSRSGKPIVGDEVTAETICKITQEISVQQVRLYQLIERWGAFGDLTFDKPQPSP